MRSLLTFMLLAAAMLPALGHAQEVDAYGCMGMLTYVGEQCKDELPKLLRMTIPSGQRGDSVMPARAQSKEHLDEIIEDNKRTYSLYNAQCREVIYAEFSEERVNEALAAANECSSALEQTKEDLSKEYNGYSCMGILDSIISRCDSSLSVPEIRSLKIELDRKIYIYNMHCSTGITADAYSTEEIDDRISEIDRCFPPLYRRAGLAPF